MAGYDIEDLEVETFDLGGDYDDDQYDDDEQYEEVGEFGEFDSATAEEKWRNKDFEELVAEMSSLVSSGKKFFFSKKKRIVNAYEIDMLSQYIQSRFPDEIAKAKDIVSRERTIIDDAKAEADSIVGDAKRAADDTQARAQAYYSDAINTAKNEAQAIIDKAQAQAHEMVMEHSITRMAREEAERIKQETLNKTQEMIANATNESNALKQRAKEYSVSIVQSAHNFVNNSLAAYQSVAASNLDRVGKVHNQFESEYSIQVKNLGISE